MYSKGSVRNRRSNIDQHSIKRISIDISKISKETVYNSAIHYCIPLLSAGFLIASVRYTASLQYGLQESVSNDGTVCVTEAKTDELEKPVTYNSLDHTITMPEFSFSSIEDSSTFNGILESIKADSSKPTAIVEDTNNSAMCNGYGIFLGDEFIGSVVDKSTIEEALDSMLQKYLSMEGVTEAHFKQSITYTQGLYLKEYMVEPDTIIDTLKGNAKEEVYYTIEDGDNYTLISEYANLSLDKLLSLNPNITNPDMCISGERVLVQEAIPYLQVEYTKTTMDKKEVPFDTLTQELNTIPKGQKEVLVDGQVGIVANITYTTYLEDQQISTKTVEDKVIKLPVSQIVAIGTAETCKDTTNSTIYNDAKKV